MLINIRCEKCRNSPYPQTYVSGIKGSKDIAKYLEITCECKTCNRKWIEIWQRTEIIEMANKNDVEITGV